MFLLLKIKIINIIIESFISLINKYLLIKNSCINRRKSSIKYFINKSDIMFYKINMHK